MPDPAPPIPSDVDLRNFGDMPLAVNRLRDSEMASVDDAEVFRCAVLAWCAAWHQVPAASLPDDDGQLARLVGMGRDVKGWRKLRAGALRGFTKASDGRLYHRVVAEKAAKAWNDKLDFAWRKECDRVRKANKDREKAGEQPLPMPPKPQRISSGWAVTCDESIDGIPAETPPPSNGIPAENALKGIDRIGSDRNLKKKPIPPPSPRPREDEADDWPSGHDGTVLTRPPSDNRSRGQRTPGDVLANFTVKTGPAEKRLKRQDRADQDMVRHLTAHAGFDTAKAWALVMAARDENDPGHTTAAREVERISREHKLGWFAGDET